MSEHCAALSSSEVILGSLSLSGPGFSSALLQFYLVSSHQGKLSTNRTENHSLDLIQLLPNSLCIHDSLLMLYTPSILPLARNKYKFDVAGVRSKNTSLLLYYKEQQASLLDWQTMKYLMLLVENCFYL